MALRGTRPVIHMMLVNHRIKCSTWSSMAIDLLRRGNNLSKSKQIVLVTIWKASVTCSVLGAISTLCCCYTLKSPSNSGVNDLPVAAQFRLHAEKPAAMNAACSNEQGLAIAVGEHGAALQSSDAIHWDASNELATSVSDCVGYKHSFIAVGVDGGIYFLSEAKVWQPIQSGTDNSLLSVVRLDSDNLVAAGLHGTVRISSDGKKWISRNIPSSADVRSLTVCRPEIWALASDGKAWRSINAGRSWQPRDTQLKDATAIGCNSDTSTLIAANQAGKMARSVDDGQTWTTISIDQDIPIFSFLRLEKKHWIATGGIGLVIESQDDGVSWDPFQSATNQDIRRLALINNQIVGVGTQGLVLTGTDAHSLLLVHGTPYMVTKFLPGDSDRAFAFGYGGHIFELRKSQPPVKVADVGTFHDITGAAFSAKAHVYWIGTNFGHLFRSPDGITWSEVPSPKLPASTRTDYVAVAASDDGHTVIVGRSDAIVSVSHDAGASWSDLSPTLFKIRVLLLSGQSVIVAGEDGGIAVNDGLGKDWTNPRQTGNDTFFAGAHDTNGTVVLVGDTGSIMTSVDGGRNWANSGKNINETRALNAVACQSICSRVVAAGKQGAAWMSSNYGKYWDQLPQPSVDYADVRFHHDSLQIMLGDGSFSEVTDYEQPWARGYAGSAKALVWTQKGLLRLDDDGNLTVSVDDGDTWKAISAPPTDNRKILSLAATEDGHVLRISGQRGLLATTNRRWNFVDNGIGSGKCRSHLHLYGSTGCVCRGAARSHSEVSGWISRMDTSC